MRSRSIEVFNRPRTEFVARFLGGHNVFEANGRAFTVRVDHLHVAPYGVTPVQAPAAEGDINTIGGVPCMVRDVEYQGTHLRMTLRPLDGSPDLISLSARGVDPSGSSRGTQRSDNRASFGAPLKLLAPPGGILSIDVPRAPYTTATASNNRLYPGESHRIRARFVLSTTT
jgi:hypothetical protein